MKIFLSHSSRQKPLLREVKHHLPHHLSTWLDEEKLIFGDQLVPSIEAAIKTSSDYVILFIDEAAARSEWVRREIDWTLAAEKNSGRTMLLPVLVDDGALVGMPDEGLGGRKYLKLKDFTEFSVRALAESISAELFALVCRDVEQLRQPKPLKHSDRLAEAEAQLRATAAIVQKAVFPHRQNNAIAVEKLREIVNSYSEDKLTRDEFDSVLASMLQRGLVPGLSYDGSDVHLVEEHSQWKADHERAKKVRIGKRASQLVQNGMKILIDAGSTSEEVVKVLCKKIETRALTRMTIATTSVNIADMISDCCVKMGFDDDFSAVRLFVPGGQVRPNTQAIVSAFGTLSGQIKGLADAVGGFDLGFVGVNGVDCEKGFTTHENAEASNKQDIMGASARAVILGDSSKLGLVLERCFATFADPITFVVDDNPASDILRALVDAHGSKVVLAS